MASGGLAGEITFVRPENDRGYVINHPGAAPSSEGIRDARDFLARGSKYVLDRDAAKVTPEECSDTKPENRPLYCPLTPSVNSVPSGTQAPHKSCDAYETARQAIIDQINKYCEDQKLSYRITDISRTGPSPDSDIDYCNVEAKTNAGVLLKMKYHFAGENNIELKLIEAVSDTAASTTP